MDDTFDDGLVHGHDWATDKPLVTAKQAAVLPLREDEYDDGLVHGHDWASSGK